YLLNLWNRIFFDALGRRDASELWTQALVFGLSMHRRFGRLPKDGLVRWSRSRQHGRLRVLTLHHIDRRAGQVPHNTRGNEIKVDLTVDCLPHHRVDNRAAEAAALRRRHRWPIALNPAHHEGIALKLPAHIDTAGVHR